VPQDGCGAAVGQEERGEDGEERRLPGAVGAEEPVDRPRGAPAGWPLGAPPSAACPRQPLLKVFRRSCASTASITCPSYHAALRPRGHGWAGPGGLNRLDASGRTDAWRRAKLTAQCGAVSGRARPRPDGEVPPHAPGQAGRRLRGECRRPLSRLRQLLPPRRHRARPLAQRVHDRGRAPSHLLHPRSDFRKRTPASCVEGPCPGPPSMSWPSRWTGHRWS